MRPLYLGYGLYPITRREINGVLVISSFQGPHTGCNMMKFVKLLIRICLGVVALVAFGLVSPLLVLVCLMASFYDKHLVDSA